MGASGTQILRLSAASGSSGLTMGGSSPAQLKLELPSRKLDGENSKMKIGSLHTHLEARRDDQDQHEDEGGRGGDRAPISLLWGDSAARARREGARCGWSRGSGSPFILRRKGRRRGGTATELKWILVVKAWRWWRHFKRGMERSSCVGAPVH